LPELLSTEARERLVSYFEERFGLGTDVFHPFYMYAFKRQVFLFRRQEEMIPLPEGSFVRCGLPFVRLVAGYLKPTTVFLQRFGQAGSQNTVSLEWKDVKALCSAGEISLDKASMETGRLEPQGYVIIKALGHVLGAGLLLEESRLLCRFPKAIRQALARIATL